MSLPLLRTERLYAKPISEKYLEQIHLLHSNPEVMRYIRPPDKDLEESRHALIEKMLNYVADDPGYGNWAVHLQDNDAFIGWGLLKHLEDSGLIEIGYRFYKRYRGKGYATEIAAASRDHGSKTLGLDRIVGITHHKNFGSQRVLEKIGLEYKRMDHYHGLEVKFFEMMKPSP